MQQPETLEQRLAALALAGRVLCPQPLASPYPGWVLFLTIGGPQARARVYCGRGASFDEAWQEACVAACGQDGPWLRLDVVKR